jgi:hypothetical protein
MKEFLKEQMTMLDRSIVATPNEEYLNDFAKANGGSNDFLLMQFSKNYGYKLALELVAEKLNINLNEL